MPEGDTVWLAGRRLDAALGGRTLTGSDFRVPALATVDLSGRTVLGVVSRGKHLLTRVDDGRTLHTHFRMDGTWHLYRPGVARRGGPDWQVRVVLTTADREAVGYRLPVVELWATADEERHLGHLGPDLLGEDWGAEAAALAVARLAADADREVGQALRDQRTLAGLGNLYTAELCFLRGVSPWTPVRDVPDLAGLVDLAHRLLAVNADRVEQVTTGDRRRGRDHWVFERSGRPCLRCGTPVTTAMQGSPPYQRITYWCSSCQPGPAPAPVRPAERAGRPAGRTRYRP